MYASRIRAQEQISRTFFLKALKPRREIFKLKNPESVNAASGGAGKRLGCHFSKRTIKFAPVLRDGKPQEIRPIESEISKSDKPMVPAFFMAAGYQVLEWITGLQARSRPELFVYAMPLISSGLAYVVAVLSIHLLGRRV